MSHVEDKSLTEEIPAQVRKTDRMLTKILQKLQRLGPSDDQKVSGDGTEAENGMAFSERTDVEKVPDEISDLPANFTSSEHVMDSRHASASSHGPRLSAAEWTKSESIYTNGDIHHETNDDCRSRTGRSFLRTQQKAEEALKFSKQARTNDIFNGPTLPKLTTKLVDDDPTPLASISVVSGQTSPRQRETERPAWQLQTEIQESKPPSYEIDHRLSKSRDVASELMCSMCQREYSEPRFLPCLHSFCYRCLEEEVTHRTEDRIRCPKCQKDFDLERFLSVKGLPPNFVVTTLIDKAALERFELEPISCSSCEERLPATVRCTDCMDYLCSTCHIAHHRLRLTKGHQILALQDIRRSKNVAELLHRPMFCPQHSQEKIRFYCESCEQAICRVCSMGKHSTRDHRYCSVSEAIDRQRVAIEQLLEEVRKREPLLRQAIRTVEEVNAKLCAKAQMAKSEINKCYPKLLQALEERHKFMLNEVDKMFHGKAKVLNFQQRGLEMDLENLLNTCKVTDDVLRHGNETEVLVVKKMLSDRLEALHSTKIRQNPEENDVVYFHAQEETMLKAIQTLGSVKVSSAYAALSCVVGGLKRVPHGKKSSFTVNTRDHYGTQCSDGGERLQVNIQSMAGDYTLAEIGDNRDGSYNVSFCPTKLGTHRVTVCIQNEHVQGSPFTVQVVQSGGMILKFGRKGSNVGEFNGIFGVAVDPVEGRIVVTDCHNHRVQVFSSDGVFLFHFGRKGECSGEFQCPTGVAIDVRGQIIVCERLSYRLQVFSRDGSFLREYRIPDLKASTLAVGNGDQIVIADSANRCVHVVNMETGHSIKFGSFGDETGELSYPCYVAVTEGSHIVVSDMHSHKIQVFDSRGQFLFNFGKKGSLDGELLRPTGVAVSREGHIIVADRDNHRIQMFSADGKFLYKFGCKGDGDGQLNDPHGLAITKDGCIVVADFRNNRVQVFGLNQFERESMH